jgi:hypothetical protein
MESVFKKMILVPEQNFTRHGATPEYLTELDQQMKAILHSQHAEDIKIRLYNDVLQKRIQAGLLNIPELPKEEKESDPVAATSKEEEEEEEESAYLSSTPEILSSVPKSQQNNAKTLMNILRQHPNIIHFNNKGEVVYHGKSIPGSNFASLLNFTLRRPGKAASIPTGFSQYKKAILSLNLPQGLIKNKQHFFNQSGGGKKKKVKLMKKRIRNVIRK